MARVDHSSAHFESIRSWKTRNMYSNNSGMLAFSTGCMSQTPAEEVRLCSRQLVWQGRAVSLPACLRTCCGTLGSARDHWRSSEEAGLFSHSKVMSHWKIIIWIREAAQTHQLISSALSLHSCTAPGWVWWWAVWCRCALGTLLRRHLTLTSSFKRIT